MDAVARIRAARVVAILRRVPAVEHVCDELVAAGITVLEVTLDSDDALETIARLRARGDATVLAGTVRTEAEAAAAIAAGAEACVGPAFVPAVVEQCLRLGVPAIPGALTPTEIEAAWQAGAALVKVFPGTLGGPGYLREIVAPLRDIPLLVTGGINADNAADFLAAGAVAVGVGSSLTGAADIAAEARRLVGAVLAGAAVAGRAVGRLEDDRPVAYAWSAPSADLRPHPDGGGTWRRERLTGAGSSGSPSRLLSSPRSSRRRPVEAAKPRPPYVLGVSNTLVGNGWREQLICSIKAQALASGKVSKVIVANRNGGPAEQIADIRTLIAAGANAIIVYPSSPDALNSVISQAGSRGIKIVAVDQRVTAPQAYAATNDQVAYGRVGAAWLFKTLGGKGNVVELRGIAGGPRTPTATRASSRR